MLNCIARLLFDFGHVHFSLGGLGVGYVSVLVMGSNPTVCGFFARVDHHGSGWCPTQDRYASGVFKQLCGWIGVI